VPSEHPEGAGRRVVKSFRRPRHPVLLVAQHLGRRLSRQASSPPPRSARRSPIISSARVAAPSLREIRCAKNSADCAPTSPPIATPRTPTLRRSENSWAGRQIVTTPIESAEGIRVCYVVKERDGNQSEPCGRNSGRHIGLARVILARVTLAVLSFTCAAGASAAAMTFKTRTQRAASLSEPPPRPSSAVTSGRPKFEALRT
jgi:hypothetical protein